MMQPPARPVADDQAKVIAWLSDPQVYPDQPREVRRIETHISQVFLTDRYVYKLKKGVRFEFLDFLTVERRGEACRDELRLNRRLAPDVYLAVLPITEAADGSLLFGGAGRTVDWVVQMRRLPTEQTLDELCRNRCVADADVRRLADFLAAYYAAAPTSDVNPDDYVASLLHHVRANAGDLLAATGDDPDVSQIRRIHTTQLRLLIGNPELFRARASGGRVIDGHGDLRPEHICLCEPIAVFDCIEFSADLRRIDVFDELCFLAMECDALDAGGVGERVLEAYLRASNDRPPPELSPFYKSYRACVRAKVAALRARQLAANERAAQLRSAQRYLTLADGYLKAAGACPLLVVVTGIMGSGKSTLARALAESWEVELLSTDVLRDQLFPADGRSDAFDGGRYRPEARARVYEELLRRTGERLSRGESVVLDGSFPDAARRESVLRQGCELGAEVQFVQCVCPRETALERIAKRYHEATDASEARPELYDLQAVQWHEYTEALPACCVDTTQPLDTQLALVHAVSPGPLRSLRSS